MQYSNPRRLAKYDDWPIGGKNRGQCKFEVEVNARGERVLKSTTNKHGSWCKPKATTYAKKCAIVDGDDGKTYILQLTDYAIRVETHDGMSAGYYGTDNEHFSLLREMIETANVTGGNNAHGTT